MSNNKKNKDSNNNLLKDKLVIEEFKQRYEQYRMHNENRNKYIHFYFIFYFAFWGLVGFLTKPESICLWKKLLCIHSTDYLLALVFLAHAIFGSIFFLSIISFRQIQSREAETIHMIKGLSENSKLVKEIKYPWDRKIPCTKITVTSQTPLVLLIFMLNSLSFILSILFYCRFCIFSCWQDIFCCNFALIKFHSTPYCCTSFSYFFLFCKYLIVNFWKTIVYLHLIIVQIFIWISIYLFLRDEKWKPKNVCWSQVGKLLKPDC
jgi:hypothetical protein